jgi:hypothetical protein
MNKSTTFSIIAILTLLTTIPFEAVTQEPKDGTDGKSLQLLDFNGDFADRFVQIAWTPIANPENVSYYYVQYARYGKNFKTIGKVYANLKNSYSFNSIVYHAGVNYFRIVQVGKDDKELTSRKLNIMCGFADRYELDFKQNTKEIKLKFQVKSEQKVIVEILDEDGKLKQKLFKGSMMAGEMIFRTIDISDWYTGKYYLSLRGESFRENKEVIIP